jgi:hypothetical protein
MFFRLILIPFFLYSNENISFIKKQNPLIYKDMSLIYDPFFPPKQVQKIKQQEVSSLHLLIILNQSANINNKWYNLGDAIMNYKIIEINDKSIKIQKNNDIIKMLNLNNTLLFKKVNTKSAIP